MRGQAEIIDVLNQVLTNELTAVNQYYLHAAMQKNWGYAKLAAYTRAESIDEMKHADILIDRILFLEGYPNLQRLHPLNIGEHVREQFEADMAVEVRALETLRTGMALCAAAGDTVTRMLLEEITRSEEEHIDYLETQLALMDSLGDQLYLSRQVEA
jgi:bacterioferritin